MTGSSETTAVTFTLVEDKDSLSSLAAGLAGVTRVGVDVEADSMFHYDEKVCLIQLSTPSDNYIVDPLKLPGLEELEKVFSDPVVEKVFHGADFDVRSLRRDFSFQIRGLFDTQIAARFLGRGDVGLARLVRDFFGVDLEKKFRKRNWSARPLPMEMLLYGMLDSYYLLDLAEVLKRELEALGRLDWVRQECEILSLVSSTANGEEPLFTRFKGAGRLDPRSLAMLEAILRFRDSVAARRDVPHFKVMGNEAVKELMLARPTDMDDLKASRILSPRQTNSMGRALVREISVALELADADLPVYPSRPKSPRAPGTTARFAALKKWRDRRAKEMGLDPSVVCSTPVLKSLAGDPPEGLEDLEPVPGLKGWRFGVFGSEIMDVIRNHPVTSGPSRRRRRPSKHRTDEG